MVPHSHPHAVLICAANVLGMSGGDAALRSVYLLAVSSIPLLGLLVVTPHAEDLHDVLIINHLVDEAMLDVDTPRVGTGQVAD